MSASCERSVPNIYATVAGKGLTNTRVGFPHFLRYPCSTLYSACLSSINPLQQMSSPRVAPTSQSGHCSRFPGALANRLAAVHTSFGFSPRQEEQKIESVRRHLYRAFRLSCQSRPGVGSSSPRSRIRYIPQPLLPNRMSSPTTTRRFEVVSSTTVATQCDSSRDFRRRPPPQIQHLIRIPTQSVMARPSGVKGRPGGTVASQMSGVATGMADAEGRVGAGLRAARFAVAHLTTVSAGLCLVVAAEVRIHLHG